MKPPSEILESLQAKSVEHLNKGNFPRILVFEGRHYEIRYTPRGGLIMKGYDVGPRSGGIFGEPLTQLAPQP